MIVILSVIVGLGFAWFCVKYPWWRAAVGDAQPRILMYHMVREPILGAKFNGLRVSPSAFERQIAWLKRNGWCFSFLSELMNSPSISKRTVVITFDDGFEDNYTNALPVLRKYGAKATLFLVVQRENNDWSVKKKAHHSSGEVVAEPKLSDDQVREMIDSGCFEIGGHSLSHADFSKLSSEEKRHEMAEGSRILREQFDVSVDTYAYPFGIYDAEDVALAKETGHVAAVTTVEGIDSDVHVNPHELKRVKVSGRKNFLYFVLSMRIGFRALCK